MSLRILRLTAQTRLPIFMGRRLLSTPIRPQPSEHKVVCDGQTLYLNQEIMQALGWPNEPGVEGLSLSLHRWDPNYIAVTVRGSDSERLAKGTVESSTNRNVQTVLDILKDR
ncbi:hypothetical protein HGRIS_006184 [Hohenbuehelia grisea]|uniref:Uncharacterized protein n=1 Tax=Hohenbuehelia grisea TaxID=104357 RepID=A0ABR3K1Q3_9AGAR